ncbi:MAG: glycoside hydrolase family 43 protein [Paludibacteraceae bacterium]|nr:glycoside hydrolase family 43 protein [Paludibacteraceae bacterium]
MKHHLLIPLIFAFSAITTFCNLIKAQQNEIFFADPSIYYAKGKYYLTGTRAHSPVGFSVLISKNLTDWYDPKQDGKKPTMLLNKGNNTYGNQGFWAPQILKKGKSYFLTYTANEQVAIAKSEKITGPYIQTKVEPIDSSAKNIDSFIFKDDNGKYYLYHVRFNRGNFIWVAEYDFKNGKIKSETLTQCLKNTQAWETTANYPSDPIMEGPTVIKMKGYYYLFYSANHFRNIDYAVGYATAKSPFGPWTKFSGNPLIHRSNVGENGAGHGDLFFDKKKKPYYVYHVHYSESEVAARRTRIVPLQFKLNKQTGIYDISIQKEKIIIPKTR